MIYYFSGTGNSEWLARTLAAHCGEEVCWLPEAMREGNFQHTLQNDEILGFVFPVIAWNPPEMVVDFVKKLRLQNDTGQYRFAVSASCRGQAGGALSELNHQLKKNGRGLSAAWTVETPNNYIIGGDVAPPEEIAQQLAHMRQEANRIAPLVAARTQDTSVFRKSGGLGNRIAGKAFNALMLDAKPFNATDACTGCGLCRSVCPAGIITLQQNGKPEWEDARCTLCLACLHRCPERAVQYGKGTLEKGRYYNPMMHQDGFDAAQTKPTHTPSEQRNGDTP